MTSRSPQESEKKKHSTHKDCRILLTPCQMKTEEGLDGNIYLKFTEYVCICRVGSATDWDRQWVEDPPTGMGSLLNEIKRTKTNILLLNQTRSRTVDSIHQA